MKYLTKIIAFTLLVAFFGLLTLGTIVDKSTSLNQHNGSVDCFGATCGPVQHVVMHNYLVAEAIDSGEQIESRHQNFIYSDSLPQFPTIETESPPPRISLV